MNNGAGLNGPELFWLGSLILIFAVDFLGFVNRRDPLAIYQPPVFVMAYMSFYCIIGPIQRAISNDWVFIFRDFRPDILSGWSGAVVFYLSLRLGYGLFRSWKPNRLFAPPFDEQVAARLGSRLCWIGILLFSSANGLRVIAYLNPLDVLGSPFFQSQGFDLGIFTNYANLSINLLIPGTLLLFTSWVRCGKPLIPWVLWSLVSGAIYTSLGFRWRIVTLVVPMLLLWFIARGRRPSPLSLAAAFLGLLALSGLIGQTRSYSVGLVLDQASSFSLQGLLDVGLDETSVFLNTAGLIANTPDRIDFVGFQPLISTILFPIPKDFWQGKDSFEYLLKATAALYQSSTYGIGQAALNYAEYYLMFGWVSLVGMGLFSGWLLRCLWNWFSLRRTETLAQVIYLCTCALLYVWIARGYLPQFVTTLAFGSAPLFWFYYRIARPLPPI